MLGYFIEMMKNISIIFKIIRKMIMIHHEMNIKHQLLTRNYK